MIQDQDWRGVMVGLIVTSWISYSLLIKRSVSAPILIEQIEQINPPCFNTTTH